MKRGVGSWAGLAVVVLSGCFGNDAVPQVPVGMHELRVNNRQVLAEVVATPIGRETGLMHRSGLGKDRGMIFCFPDSAPRSFYMKNCLFPIDVAFLDESGKILVIHTMAVETKEHSFLYTKYPSGQPASHALEMTGGWFAENGVKAGDVIEKLPPLARQ
ncbi:MAG: DUF192 domain-containing protein [Planctomycetota bacterium]